MNDNVSFQTFCAFVVIPTSYFLALCHLHMSKEHSWMKKIYNLARHMCRILLSCVVVVVSLLPYVMPISRPQKSNESKHRVSLFNFIRKFAYFSFWLLCKMYICTFVCMCTCACVCACGVKTTYNIWIIKIKAHKNMNYCHWQCQNMYWKTIAIFAVIFLFFWILDANSCDFK